MESLSKRLARLFERYLHNTLSDAERAEFFELLHREGQQEELKELINIEIEKLDIGDAAIDHFISDENSEAVLQKILKGRNQSGHRSSGTTSPGKKQSLEPVSYADRDTILTKEGYKQSIGTRWRMAASVVVLLGAGLYLFFANRSEKKLETFAAANRQVVYDIAPGRNNAVITMSDGTKMNLDSIADGKIGQEENTKVIKLDGRLSYKSAGINRRVLYNTISTVRGNQYSLVLPDGTKVWLNAESSITFPTAFTDNQRNVKISGEAYLEVAKNKHMPFKVSFSDGAEIEVLGTHFNISSYKDEPGARATLLEGKIRISRGHKMSLLKPGEQAYIKGDNPFQIIKDVDVEAAVAWKNGFFSFSDADIQTVMHHLARWYDLDVTYKGAIGKERFSGEIDRTLTLVSVLKILEKTKVHFRIEKNNQLIILP